MGNKARCNFSKMLVSCTERPAAILQKMFFFPIEISCQYLQMANFLWDVPMGIRRHVPAY